MSHHSKGTTVKTAKITRSPARHLFGLSHKQIVSALKAHVTKAGLPINEEIGCTSYVIGLERRVEGEYETMLTMVVEEMPSFMKPSTSSMSCTVSKGELSPRAEPGSQKFEITHNGVRDALVAFCVAESGNPIPDGLISLWGLGDPVLCVSHNSFGHRPAPALTLFIDPS